MRVLVVSQDSTIAKRLSKHGDGMDVVAVVAADNIGGYRGYKFDAAVIALGSTFLSIGVVRAVRDRLGDLPCVVVGDAVSDGLPDRCAVARLPLDVAALAAKLTELVRQPAAKRERLPTERAVSAPAVSFAAHHRGRASALEADANGHPATAPTGSASPAPPDTPAPALESVWDLPPWPSDDDIASADETPPADAGSNLVLEIADDNGDETEMFSRFVDNGRLDPETGDRSRIDDDVVEDATGGVAETEVEASANPAEESDEHYLDHGHGDDDVTDEVDMGSAPPSPHESPPPSPEPSDGTSAPTFVRRLSERLLRHDPGETNGGSGRTHQSADSDLTVDGLAAAETIQTIVDEVPGILNRRATGREVLAALSRIAPSEAAVLWAPDGRGGFECLSWHGSEASAQTTSLPPEVAAAIQDASHVRVYGRTADLEAVPVEFSGLPGDAVLVAGLIADGELHGVAVLAGTGYRPKDARQVSAETEIHARTIALAAHLELLGLQCSAAQRQLETALP